MVVPFLYLSLLLFILCVILLLVHVVLNDTFFHNTFLNESQVLQAAAAMWLKNKNNGKVNLANNFCLNSKIESKKKTDCQDFKWPVTKYSLTLYHMSFPHSPLLRDKTYNTNKIKWKWFKSQLVFSTLATGLARNSGGVKGMAIPDALRATKPFFFFITWRALSLPQCLIKSYITC